MHTVKSYHPDYNTPTSPSIELEFRIGSAASSREAELACPLVHLTEEQSLCIYQELACQALACGRDENSSHSPQTFGWRREHNRFYLSCSDIRSFAAAMHEAGATATAVGRKVLGKRKLIATWSLLSAPAEQDTTLLLSAAFWPSRYEDYLPDDDDDTQDIADELLDKMSADLGAAWFPEPLDFKYGMCQDPIMQDGEAWMIGHKQLIEIGVRCKTITGLGRIAWVFGQLKAKHLSKRSLFQAVEQSIGEPDELEEEDRFDWVAEA